MKALCSVITGIAIPDSPGSDTSVILDVVAPRQWSPLEQLHLISTIPDLHVVEAPSEQSLLSKLSDDYWHRWVTEQCILILAGLSDALTIRVLEHVDDLLSTRVSPDSAICDLLPAPLLTPDRANYLSNIAISHGWAVIGNVFHDLFDFQPLLRRLHSQWLALPPSLFAEILGGREVIWKRIVESRIMRDLLLAESANRYRSLWNTLAFSETRPPARTAVSLIGKALADRIFSSRPATVIDQHDQDVYEYENDENTSGVAADKQSASSKLVRVQKEIAAIVDAVVSGHDSKARRFLKELITRQLGEKNREFAVKTLCNIAKKCADMFRTDFENECLTAALTIDADDPWTLVQMGDHLKRAGRYDESIEFSERAVRLGESLIGVANIADVWSLRGEYQKAIDLYKAIPGWEMALPIRTAIADNLRRIGDLGAAEEEYERILRDPRLSGQPLDRIFAGKAEVAKSRGDYAAALQAYDTVLHDSALTEQGRLMYEIARCHLLKLNGQLIEALNTADHVVQVAPFFMSARFQRASIFGLLGKSQAGLDDLPFTNAPATFREWRRQYVRGLLLLTLDRYEEARSELIGNLSIANTDSNERAIIRLGAAIAYLANRGMNEASAVLSEIGDISDTYTQYLLTVLKLHIATLREDGELIERITNELVAAADVDPSIALTIDLLHSGDLGGALAQEIELLLRAA